MANNIIAVKTLTDGPSGLRVLQPKNYFSFEKIETMSCSRQRCAETS